MILNQGCQPEIFFFKSLAKKNIPVLLQFPYPLQLFPVLKNKN